MNAKIGSTTGLDAVIRLSGFNEQGSPAGKLADAEIVFGPGCGFLAGLKLIGFGVWERRTPNSKRNVTFPARSYSVNGERRSFALLRPSGDDMNAHDTIRDAILAAYAQHEADEAAR